MLYAFLISPMRATCQAHIIFLDLIGSRDSSVVQRWATGCMIWGSRSGRGWTFFSSPPRPDRLWDLPSLLSNGYRGHFPWG
jgi:hypothetical protein